MSESNMAVHSPVDPFDADSHSKYISSIRLLESSSPSFHEHLANAYLKKLEHFVLSPIEYTQWMDDVNKLEDIEQQKTFLLKIYSYIVKDYSVVEYWKPYLELAISCEDLHLIDEASLNSLFEEALYDTVYDYQNTSKIWKIIISYYEAKLQDDDLFSKLVGLHKRRLSYPHETLDESFQDFSSFISNNDPKNYSKHMPLVNKVYSRSKRQQRYYEIHELKISKDPSNINLWLEYLQAVCEYANGDIQKMNTLFARATYSVDNIQIWLSYLYVIYDPKNKFSKSQTETFLTNFVRKYPESPLSHAEYIRNCLEFVEGGYQKFLSARNRVNSSNLMEASAYDEWKILALSILTSETSITRTGENLDIVDLLYADIGSFVEFAITKNNDGFHTVEKTSIVIFEELEDLESCISILDRLLKNFRDQSDIWLYVCERQKKYGTPVEQIAQILEFAIENPTSLDWPEKIIQEWLSMKQLNFDLEEYKRSLLKANSAFTLVNLERIKRQEVAEQIIEESIEKKRPHDEEPDEQSKRQKPSESKEQARNREEFTVRVTNLPNDITEKRVSQLFKDCGEIREIKLIEVENELPQATVEFSSEKELLAAVTKNLKMIGEQVVNVFRAVVSTVWITNFPPSMGHGDLENYFGSIGKVVSIRFPSLKYNNTRRFGYVEYATAELANHAVTTFDGNELKDELDGKTYRLVVKISKPEDKLKRKDNAVYESREIFIQNLDFKKVSKDVLEKEFTEYGDIERIVLPAPKQHANDKGTSKNLNSGFGFITFKSAVSATNSLAKNGQVIMDRKVQVSIAQPKKDIPHKELKFDFARTISILNLSDTINQEQVNKFAGVVGRISKIDLRPQENAALVEFEEVADSGKASLILAGKVIEGKPVEIGTYFDLKKKVNTGGGGAGAAAGDKPKLMMPASVAKRRKKKQE
ncbi:hypothetical protein CLIB1423_09S04500 [[Candida] railenensis]|uniref:RRM domain-containing protein n=1 Tax=[Candida] railenensis TaxID=45579 RepID=A0A9P0QRQ1_9ASCO|nr:hypothetical protein CLIB1423_09S04500 [[Candida] railenensis]